MGTVDKQDFDERFRAFVPPEYRPGLDFQRATFDRAQGRITTGMMVTDMFVGLARGIAEWYEENPQARR